MKSHNKKSYHSRNLQNIWLLILLSLFLSGCTTTIRKIPPPLPPPPSITDQEETEDLQKHINILKEKLDQVLLAAELPAEIVQKIKANCYTDTGLFYVQLVKILASDDRFLYQLVDKQRPLPADYKPDDLIELLYKSYRAGISDVMMLRRKAEAALEEMAAAARAAGFPLTVSSAYRSYEYQIGSFERWTARLGLERAEQASARPGRSQHQLGLAVDFGSITNDFAATPAGKWVAANAGRFGFSLSYPRGYEHITGYGWESWHYRYVGQDMVIFIDTWFGGIQQYALRFIHEWEIRSL